MFYYYACIQVHYPLLKYSWKFRWKAALAAFHTYLAIVRTEMIELLESTKCRILLEIFNVRHAVIMHNIYDSKVTSLFSDLAHFFLLKTPQLFMHV